MTDLGKNGGVTGLITLAGGAAPFNGQVESWDAGLGNIVINRAGPGTNGPAVRCESGSGSISIKAIVNKKGFPFPASLEKVSGTITLQWTVGVTIEIPIMVMSIGISGKSTDNKWVLSIKAAINGIPVVAGFDGAQVAGSATFQDQSLWEGRQKSYDPAHLNDGDTEIVDVAGMSGDTGPNANAADLTKVASVVAAAAPPRAGMKVVSASIVRTGATGARVSLQYGYDDAADRMVKGSQQDARDSAGISKTAARAVVHLASAAAVAPDAPDGTKLDDQSTQPIPGSLYAVTVFRYAVDDAADRITNNQRRDTVDPDGLRSESTLALIHAATDPQPAAPSAPLAGLKVVSTSEAVINNAKSLTSFRYGLRTVKEQIENDGTTWSYSTELAGNGRSVTIVEHYTGPFEAWRIAYKDAFYADAEARSIVFRRFIFSGSGETETGTVFVTKTYRAQTASVDFMGLWKVEAGNAVAYTDHRGIYRDGDVYKVFVLRNISLGNYHEIHFGMIVSGICRSFRIIRKSSGSPSDAFASLIGKTNNAPFLGYPAGMVKYAGYAPKQLSETIWTATYDCVADTNGHIDRNGAVVGGAVPYNSTSPISGATLTIPSDVNAFPYVKIATQADLSPLVAS